MEYLKGEAVLLRILIGEADKHEGNPLYQWIVEYLKKERISGATVIRGILGYGPRSIVHTTHILRLSQDLPIVIEVVDTQENLDRVLPVIKEAVGDGLITAERVQVIKYGVGSVRKKDL